MDDPTGVAAVLGGTGMPVRTVQDLAGHAEAVGLDAVWLSQMPNQHDIGALVAALAMTTERIDVGTAVQPLYTRPPVSAAQAALTVDSLSGGRARLGVGLGHRMLGDWMMGQRRAPAVASTREYLDIVTSLVREGEVNVDGEWFGGHASCADRVREDMPVLLGTFGPRMLEVAGEVADGAIFWMCTPEYLRDHALPALRRGWARRGGRPERFRIVAMMHAAITDDPDRDRELFGRVLSAYLRAETYRELFTASGFGDGISDGTPDAALVEAIGAFGEQQVRDRARELTSVGVDEIAIVPTGRAPYSYDLCREAFETVAQTVRKA